MEVMASSASSGNISYNYNNLKEHHLPELKIHSPYLDDGLLAILHTLLFVRAPTNLKASDKKCENLVPLVFATCGLFEVDKKIDATIELLKKQLVISPQGKQHLTGEIILSFYIRREIKEWIGLFSRYEHIYFESWRLPILVLDVVQQQQQQRRHSTGDTAATDGQGGSCDIDPYTNAYDHVSNMIVSIIEMANTSTDHVPTTIQYDFEINVTESSRLLSTQQQQQQLTQTTPMKGTPGTQSTTPRNSSGGSGKQQQPMRSSSQDNNNNNKMAYNNYSNSNGSNASPMVTFR